MNEAFVPFIPILEIKKKLILKQSLLQHLFLCTGIFLTFALHSAWFDTKNSAFCLRILFINIAYDFYDKRLCLSIQP
jgi:hypothetical protein